MIRQMAVVERTECRAESITLSGRSGRRAGRSRRPVAPGGYGHIPGRPRGANPWGFMQGVLTPFDFEKDRRMRGGRRDGAGRPQGSATSKAAPWLNTHNLTPMEALLAIMRDNRTPMRLRVWCAKEAAPYVHPRLAPEPAGDV